MAGEEENETETETEYKVQSVAATELKRNQQRKKITAHAVFTFFWVGYVESPRYSRILILRNTGEDDDETRSVLQDHGGFTPVEFFPETLVVRSRCIPDPTPYVLYRGLFECSKSVSDLVKVYENWVEWPDKLLPQKVQGAMKRKRDLLGIRVYEPSPTSDTVSNAVKKYMQMVEETDLTSAFMPLDDMSQSADGRVEPALRPRKQFDTVFDSLPPSAVASLTRADEARESASTGGDGPEDPESRHTAWFSPCYFDAHTCCEKINRANELGLAAVAGVGVGAGGGGSGGDSGSGGGKSKKAEAGSKGIRLMLCARRDGACKSSKSPPDVVWKMVVLLSAQISPQAGSMAGMYDFLCNWSAAHKDGPTLGAIKGMGDQKIEIRGWADLPAHVWGLKDPFLRRFCSFLAPAFRLEPLLLWLTVYYKLPALLSLSYQQLRALAGLLHRLPLLAAFPDTLFDYVQVAAGPNTLVTPLQRRRLGFLCMDQLQQLARSVELQDERLPFDADDDDEFNEFLDKTNNLYMFTVEDFILQHHDPIPPTKKELARRRSEKNSPASGKGAAAAGSKGGSTWKRAPTLEDMRAIFGSLPEAALRKMQEVAEAEFNNAAAAAAAHSTGEEEDEEEDGEGEGEEGDGEEERAIHYGDDQADEVETEDSNAFVPLYARNQRAVYTGNMLEFVHGVTEQAWRRGHTVVKAVHNPIASDDDTTLLETLTILLDRRKLMEPSPLDPNKIALQNVAYKEYQLAKLFIDVLCATYTVHLLDYTHPTLAWGQLLELWWPAHHPGSEPGSWPENSLVVMPSQHWIDYYKSRWLNTRTCCTWQDAPDTLAYSSSENITTLVIWEAQLYGNDEMIFLLKAIEAAGIDGLYKLRHVVLAGSSRGDRPISYMSPGCPFGALYRLRWNRQADMGSCVQFGSLSYLEERYQPPPGFGGGADFEWQVPYDARGLPRLSDVPKSVPSLPPDILNAVRALNATASWKHSQGADLERPDCALKVAQGQTASDFLKALGKRMTTSDEGVDPCTVFYCGRLSKNLLTHVHSRMGIVSHYDPLKGTVAPGSVLTLLDTGEVIKIKAMYSVLNFGQRDTGRVLRLSTIDKHTNIFDPSLAVEVYDNSVFPWPVDHPQHETGCCHLGVCETNDRGQRWCYESVQIDGRPAPDQELRRRLIFPSRHDPRSGYVLSAANYFGAPVSPTIILVCPGATWAQIHQAVRFSDRALFFIPLAANPAAREPQLPDLKAILKSPYKGRFCDSMLRYYVLACKKDVLDKPVYTMGDTYDDIIYDMELCQLMDFRPPKGSSKAGTGSSSSSSSSKSEPQTEADDPPEELLDHVVLGRNGAVTLADEDGDPEPEKPTKPKAKAAAAASASAAADKGKSDAAGDDDEDDVHTSDEEFIDDGEDAGDDSDDDDSDEEKDNDFKPKGKGSDDDDDDGESSSSSSSSSSSASSPASSDDEGEVEDEAGAKDAADDE